MFTFYIISESPQSILASSVPGDGSLPAIRGGQGKWMATWGKASERNARGTLHSHGDLGECSW